MRANLFAEVVRGSPAAPEHVTLPPGLPAPGSARWPARAAATRSSSRRAAPALSSSASRSVPCGCSRTRPTSRRSTPGPAGAGAPGTGSRDRRRSFPRTASESSVRSPGRGSARRRGFSGSAGRACLAFRRSNLASSCARKWGASAKRLDPVDGQTFLAAPVADIVQCGLCATSV